MQRLASLTLAAIACAAALPLAGAYHGGTPAEVFDATFTGVRGNEWWVQTSVSAVDGTLAKVEVRLDEGDWRPLTDRGWGWAASYHAPEGTIVQFRAVSTENETDLSSCYRWTSATWSACPGEGATVRRVVFDHTGGNEWWVQVRITGEGARDITNVLAFDDSDGSVADLTLRSWGDWAGSIHLEPGHRVRFEALGYRLDEMSCWFTHPQGVQQCDGTQTSPPPPPPDGPTTFDATFSNARGNEWWVEADVKAASGTLSHVSVQVNQGAITPLAQTSWGSWAKSVYAPAGSTVTFIAYDTNGVQDSQSYTWPPK